MNRIGTMGSVRSWAIRGCVVSLAPILGITCDLATRVNLAPCSGSYAGTYSGMGGGTVAGSLTADGSLDLSFTPNNSATGLGFSYHVINIKGDFAGDNPNDISASFDVGSCRISGIWVFQGNSGVYSVSIQRP